MTKELSKSKNAFIEASEFIDQNMNQGLILKKDQGFQFLSIEDKAFLICHLYEDVKDKAEAYCISVLDKNIEDLSEAERRSAKLQANTRWKWIEQKMGGFRNIISMMGIDVVMIVRHAERLLQAEKMALDKDGVEHYFMDGGTQMKALEFLAKLSGNYADDVQDQSKTSININFNGASPKPARPVDIEDNNMEVFIGDPSKIEDQ